MNMHADEKSDEVIVPEKQPNKGSVLTLATSARLTSKSGQPDLFELSTETGQDQRRVVR